MKKLLLALLTTLMLTGAAWAEWVKVDWNTVDLSDFYIHPRTIRIDGSLGRVWVIQNLKQQSEKGELSRQAREEYDCKQERYRVLSFSTHSGPMASGNVMESYTWDPPRKWNDIPPGTMMETMLKLVCAK